MSVLLAFYTINRVDNLNIRWLWDGLKKEADDEKN